MNERRVRISQTVVEKARPAAAKYLIPDSDILGFRLVVYPTGKKAYYLRYRIGGGRGGKAREAKIGDAPGMKADAARNIARDWSAQVRLGGDPTGDRIELRNAPTMKELFERYLRDHSSIRNKPSTHDDNERVIRTHLLPVFGGKKVADVKRGDVDRFHKALAHTPYRANRCLRLLSKAFNLAEVWGYRPDHSNPVRHVAKFAEKKRKRFLSPAEFGKLGAALQQAEQGLLARPVSPYVVASIRLLAFTGARRGEILGLQWDWIDWEAGRANLPDSKTGEKTVPLNPAALTVLQSIPRLADNPFVIAGGKPGTHLVNLKDPWDLIREAAGLSGVRIHDLRHSFASVGVANGLSLPIIGAMLGHTQPQTTARYAHLSDDPIRAASDLVATRIESAMQARPRTAEAASQ